MRGRSKSGGPWRLLEIQIHDGTLTNRGQSDQAEENWDTVFSAWGRVRPLRGDEAERAHKVFAGSTHQITMHRKPGVLLTPEHRAKTSSGRFLYFGAVLDDDDRGRNWIVLASEDAHAAAPDDYTP